MANPVSVANALSNLTTLAKLVSNGDNTSEESTCIGVLKTAGGQSRIVKFVADAKTKDMNASFSALRENIASWANALRDSDEDLARGFVRFADKLDANETVVNYRSTLEAAFREVFQGEADVKLAAFKDPSVSTKAKPLSFTKTQQAIASDARFNYQEQKTSDRGRQIARAVGTRSKFRNAIHALGRKIMTATHAIKAKILGRATVAAGWNKTVGDFVAGVNQKSCVREMAPIAPDKPRVAFDAHVVAASCGLSGRIDLRPFPKGQSIYPADGGMPSIADIKQNPDLQDCWFLSSVAAMLHSQGPESITRLIDLDQVPGQAVVRLGQHHYQVPLADVYAGGQRTVSDSAPWVRILEQAMAMHLSQVESEMPKDAGYKMNASQVRMSYGSALFALNALCGLEVPNNAGFAQPIPPLGPVTFGELRTAFLMNGNDPTQGHYPMVLGTRNGVGPGLLSLGYGVSPGHVTAVLEVGDNDLTVLDPYGHVRKLQPEDLKYFALVGIDSENISKDVGALGNNLPHIRDVEGFRQSLNMNQQQPNAPGAPNESSQADAIDNLLNNDQDDW